MNVKALVIHLERATDRRQQVDRIIEQSPVPAEILDAVDARTLSEQAISSYFQRSLHKPHYPFELRTTEIACFLSHRKSWQTILDQNLDAALIIEDDVQIDATLFQPAFELALQNCQSGDYIRFPMKAREAVATTRASSATHQFFVPRVTGLGMQTQLVTREAARILLDETQQFDRPVDTFLQMTWLTKVWPTCVVPSGISELSAQLGGSCIGSKKSWQESLHREIMRPIYRLQLSSLASSSSPSHR